MGTHDGRGCNSHRAKTTLLTYKPDLFIAYRDYMAGQANV